MDGLNKALVGCDSRELIGTCWEPFVSYWEHRHPYQFSLLCSQWVVAGHKWRQFVLLNLCKWDVHVIMCRIPWNSWCAEFSGSCKAVSSRSKTRSQLSPSHCSSILACLLPTQSITLFFFFLLLEKDVKLEKNKLDSGGLRDCFLCRTHTHLCCLYKQRLQRLTDLTTIHRKLRGLTVSPGILWSRWKSAMTATLSCSPQCIHYCRL